VVKCLDGDVLCRSSAHKEGSLFGKLLPVQILIEEACIGRNELVGSGSDKEEELFVEIMICSAGEVAHLDFRFSDSNICVC
jgi:hypothetical protein